MSPLYEVEEKKTARLLIKMKPYDLDTTLFKILQRHKLKIIVQCPTVDSHTNLQDY